MMNPFPKFKNTKFNSFELELNHVKLIDVSLDRKQKYKIV